MTVRKDGSISEKNERNDKNQSENSERDLKPPEEDAIM